MTDSHAVEVLQELNSGSLLDKIDVALKHTVQGLHLRDKAKGEITIKLSLERINDTDWVNVAHKVNYKKTTLEGDLAENIVGETMMSMNLQGRLSTEAPEKGGKESAPVAQIRSKR